MGQRNVLKCPGVGRRGVTVEVMSLGARIVFPADCDMEARDEENT